MHFTARTFIEVNWLMYFNSNIRPPMLWSEGMEFDVILPVICSRHLQEFANTYANFSSLLARLYSCIVAAGYLVPPPAPRISPYTQSAVKVQRWHRATITPCNLPA